MRSPRGCCDDVDVVTSSHRYRDVLVSDERNE